MHRAAEGLLRSRVMRVAQFLVRQRATTGDNGDGSLSCDNRDGSLYEQSATKCDNGDGSLCRKCDNGDKQRGRFSVAKGELILPLGVMFMPRPLLSRGLEGHERRGRCGDKPLEAIRGLQERECYICKTQGTRGTAGRAQGGWRATGLSSVRGIRAKLY